LFAFSGSDFLVAVGYMDPGTGPQDLAEGAQFYYTLLSVVIISRLMAIFLTN
jgi:manganese transport protein